MKGDMLAILDGTVITVYAVNGEGVAHELAKAKVDDTAPDALATLLHGLKPFLADPPKPIPALMPGLPVKAAAPRAPRAPVRKRAADREIRRPATEVVALVLSHVRSHPAAMTSEISHALGYTSDASVGRALTQLLAQGRVVRQSVSATAEGPGARFQYWASP